MAGFRPDLLDYEPRCACVLLLDTSGSMLGEPIRALNAALHTFETEIKRDPLASLRVEVEVISFNSEITIQRKFTQMAHFAPPHLVAEGTTCMGQAILCALDEIDARKRYYQAHDLKYFRPWIVLITDGKPEGEAAHHIEAARTRVQAAERQKQALFFAIGVQDADMTLLASVAVRQPGRLQGLKFNELFLWLSRSMVQTSHSNPDGEAIYLPPPDL